jgi:hypothetical protein
LLQAALLTQTRGEAALSSVRAAAAQSPALRQLAAPPQPRLVPMAGSVLGAKRPAPGSVQAGPTQAAVSLPKRLRSSRGSVLRARCTALGFDSAPVPAWLVPSPGFSGVVASTPLPRPPRVTGPTPFRTTLTPAQRRRLARRPVAALAVPLQRGLLVAQALASLSGPRPRVLPQVFGVRPSVASPGPSPRRRQPLLVDMFSAQQRK